MSTKTAASIQAVYPLREVQRALLLHHLTQPEADQGLIQTRFVLRGPLDRTQFANAWREVGRRHEALRSSVQWRNMSKPVWVVHRDATLQPEEADTSNHYEEWQSRDVDDLLAADRRRGLQLDSPPAGRIQIISHSAEKHFLLWTSHHILLDGWSAGLVLREVFTVYTALCAGRTPSLEAAIRYRNYLSWLSLTDESEARSYWGKVFARLPHPTRFPEVGPAPAELASTTVPEAARRGVIEMAGRRQVTTSTVLEACWSYLLGRLFGADAVCYGVTVSGRNPAVEGVDRMVGMFSGVLPQVTELRNGLPDPDNIAADASHRIRFQGVEPDLLRQAAGTNISPFNSLLTVQNYPWSELGSPELTVTDFEGDMTSTYPVTCVVVLRDTWTVHLQYRRGALSPDEAEWILQGFQHVLRQWSTGGGAERLPDPAWIAPPARAVSRRQAEDKPYTPPRSGTQLEMVRIWERLLQTAPIGIHDDYFRIGGTSLLALRLFAEIEARLGKQLPPSTLLHHRSVAALASLIDDGRMPEWNNLVPLRAAGSLPPVFCLHAGRGHVFFYRPFAEVMPPGRPVYAIQPDGLEDIATAHESIEEMAADYLREIEGVYPGEQLILLSHCFSSAVALEMARQRVAAGKRPPVLLIIDNAPFHHEIGQSRPVRHRKKDLRWFAGNVYHRRWRKIRDYLVEAWMPNRFLPPSARSARRAAAIRHHLFRLYENYRWPDYSGPIRYIQTTTSLRRNEERDRLNVWKRITSGPVESVRVAAPHGTLFEPPHVTTLLHAIEPYFDAPASP